MQYLTVDPGTATVSVFVYLDKRPSDGSGMTGVAHTDVSVAKYCRTGGSYTSISLSALGSLTASYSSGGWYEAGDGWYRLDLPNAVCNTPVTTEAIVEVNGTKSGQFFAGQLRINLFNPVNILRWGSITIGANGGFPQVDVLLINGNTVASSAAGYMPCDLRKWNGASYMPARSGTAQAGGPTTITLDGAASIINDFYIGGQVFITGGTGFGQPARTITAYNGSTVVATVSPAWVTQPDSTSAFVILPSQHPKTDSALEVTANNVTGNVSGSVFGSVFTVGANAISRSSFAADTGLRTLRSGTCQSGSTSTTVKLDSGASSTNDYYQFCAAEITGGTGADQPPAWIISYDGSTKVATILGTWKTTPDNTSTFAIKHALPYWSNGAILP